MDTIFALSTARGKAGVAVIRVSGPKALVAAEALCGSVPPRRRAALRHLRSGDGDLIDSALVLTFGAPDSFTGEDVVEFHTHGSVAVVEILSSELGRIAGLRPAEPGEFTRRALGNDKLDLTQVEGLADLLDAETEAQRRQAVSVLDGAFGDRIETWRRGLVRAMALLSAMIDFADEDIPEDVTPEAVALIDAIVADLQREIAGSRGAERLRDGFQVAILGAPNVGKSSLLNALAGRNAAITSEIAGTTRDVIEVRMNMAGLPVTVLDTAGLRDTSDAIERQGVALARERAAKADLRVLLFDGEMPEVALQPDDIVIRSKVDLHDDVQGLSVVTGQGLDALVVRISDILGARIVPGVLASRRRHRVACEQALVHLDSARTLLYSGDETSELAVEELRRVAMTLELLLGRVDVEHLLDEIFLSFCIGK